MNSNQLPQITAPSLRVTNSAETLTSYLKGDLKQVERQAALWVRLTAQEQLDNQLALGNSKQYRAVVDGNDKKPISQAERRVIVYFVTTILARAFEKAKDVLRRSILRVSTRRTGLLSEGWIWAYQTGRTGPLAVLGPTLPKDLQLKQGDAVILLPRAGYAWFVNYYAARAKSFVPIERKRGAKRVSARRKRSPRGYGFMAYSARQLRGELKQVGIQVWPVNIRPPPGIQTRTNRGLPVLMFKVSPRLAQRGET